jgi:hypothetical protein
MSYVASTYRHVRTMPITAEVLGEISCGQGWQPGTIVESAPSRLEIDTQLVVDRLLRECFTQIPTKTRTVSTLVAPAIAREASRRCRHANAVMVAVDLQSTSDKCIASLPTAATPPYVQIRSLER